MSLWVISHKVLAKNMGTAEGWLGSDLLTLDFLQQTTTSKVGQRTVNYKSANKDMKLFCRFESIFVYLYQDVTIFS